MDVADIRDFYHSERGRAAARLIGEKLVRMVQPAAGQTVMGLGFAIPYLDALVPDTALGLAFMPGRQGVVHWPPGGACRAALVDEHDLPLLESTVDVALVVHGLEFADAPLDVLQEVWRVMAPQGRLVLVLPNRRGVWSASETTPFGHGQPFSGSQIGTLLKEARFTIARRDAALFFPPVLRPPSPRGAAFMERVGERVAPGFSGVIVIEAVKQVYAFSAGKRARRLVPRFRPVLLPSPQPTPRMPGPAAES